MNLSCPAQAQHPDAPLRCAELAVGVRAPGRRRVDVRATLAGDAWGHFVGDVRLDRADKGSALVLYARFGTADLEPLVSFDVA